MAKVINQPLRKPDVCGVAYWPLDIMQRPVTHCSTHESLSLYIYATGLLCPRFPVFGHVYIAGCKKFLTVKALVSLKRGKKVISTKRGRKSKINSAKMHWEAHTFSVLEMGRSNISTIHIQKPGPLKLTTPHLFIIRIINIQIIHVRESFFAFSFHFYHTEKSSDWKSKDEGETAGFGLSVKLEMSTKSWLTTWESVVA